MNPRPPNPVLKLTLNILLVAAVMGAMVALIGKSAVDEPYRNALAVMIISTPTPTPGPVSQPTYVPIPNQALGFQLPDKADYERPYKAWKCAGGKDETYWLYMVLRGIQPTREQAGVPYATTRAYERGYSEWVDFPARLRTTEQFMYAINQQRVEFWLLVQSTDLIVAGYPVNGCMP